MCQLGLMEYIMPACRTLETADCIGTFMQAQEHLLTITSGETSHACYIQVYSLSGRATVHSVTRIYKNLGRNLDQQQRQEMSRVAFSTLLLLSVSPGYIVLLLLYLI